MDHERAWLRVSERGRAIARYVAAAMVAASCLLAWSAPASAQSVAVSLSGMTYLFNGGAFPPLYRGSSYTFTGSNTTHPLKFQVEGPPSTWTDYSTGVSGMPLQGGTMTFAVASNAPSQLRYICTAHGIMMTGLISVLAPQAAGQACSASVPCGSGLTCVGGVCCYEASCGNNTCLTGACGTNGHCSAKANNTGCNDGNSCTAGEHCSGAGACLPGTCQVGTPCGVVCGHTKTCQQPQPGVCTCQ